MMKLFILLVLSTLCLCALAKIEPVGTPQPVHLCSASGDPHYHSFDGKEFNMYGTGDYVLVDFPATTEHSEFIVHTRLTKWGTGSANTALAVKVNGNKVIITADTKTIEANGKAQPVVDEVHLPHGTRIKKVADNVFRVIARDGSAVEARIGVDKFAYMDIHVYLRDTYKGKVSGLCGNFDGKIDNDGTDSTGAAYGVKYADAIFAAHSYPYANTDKPTAWKDQYERIRAIRLCRSVGATKQQLKNCVRDYKLTRDVTSIETYRHLTNDIRDIKSWVKAESAKRDASSLKGDCKTRLAKVLYIARKQRAVIKKLKETLAKTVKVAQSVLEPKVPSSYHPFNFNDIYNKKKTA